MVASCRFWYLKRIPSRHQLVTVIVNRDTLSYLLTFNVHTAFSLSLLLSSSSKVCLLVAEEQTLVSEISLYFWLFLYEIIHCWPDLYCSDIMSRLTLLNQCEAAAERVANQSRSKIHDGLTFGNSPCLSDECKIHQSKHIVLD